MTLRDGITRRLVGPEVREALETARLAAGVADEAARTASQAAAAVQEWVSDERSGRRAAWVWSIVVVAVLGGSFGAIAAAKAFRNPLITSSDYGTAEIALTPNGKPGSQLPFGDRNVTVNFFAQFRPEDNQATYSFWVPREFAGQRFAILLEGAARLGGLSASVPLTDVTEAVCGTGSVPAGQRCQWAYGTLPTSADFLPDSPCSETAAINSAVLVTFTGTWRHLSEPDWAHQRIDIPSFVGDYTIEATSRFYDHPLRGSWATPLLAGCRTLEPPYQSEIVETWNGPTRTAEQGTLIWQEDAANYFAQVITRRGSAESRADLYLWACAALVALGVGLIPTGFEAWREYRREKRRSAKRAGQPQNRS